MQAWATVLFARESRRAHIDLHAEVNFGAVFLKSPSILVATVHIRLLFFLRADATNESEKAEQAKHPT